MAASTHAVRMHPERRTVSGVMVHSIALAYGSGILGRRGGYLLMTARRPPRSILFLPGDQVPSICTQRYVVGWMWSTGRVGRTVVLKTAAAFFTHVGSGRLSCGGLHTGSASLGLVLLLAVKGVIGTFEQPQAVGRSAPTARKKKNPPRAGPWHSSAIGPSVPSAP